MRVYTHGRLVKHTRQNHVFWEHHPSPGHDRAEAAQIQLVPRPLHPAEEPILAPIRAIERGGVWFLGGRVCLVGCVREDVRAAVQSLVRADTRRNAWVSWNCGWWRVRKTDVCPRKADIPPRTPSYFTAGLTVEVTLIYSGKEGTHELGLDFLDAVARVYNGGQPVVRKDIGRHLFEDVARGQQSQVSA